MLNHLANLLVLLSVIATNAVTHHCYYNYQLRGVFNMAFPGDEILLYPGRYVGNFEAYNDGEPGKSITIRSSDPNDKAVIDGITYDDQSTIGLYIAGHYWTVKDLIIENANKGIVFENVIGGEIIDCEVRKIGEEAIHIRDGSSNVLIEGNSIHNTGLYNAGYGEAIYLGSDKSVHYYYNATVSFVTVRDNLIGPDVRAEGIDVKEGTHDILIENNDFDAAGLTGANHADSFIDLKGTKATVRYNTFKQSGNSKLKSGINVIDRGVDLSAHDHVIAFNTFDLESTNIPMVQANQNTQNVHVMDNTRSPSGTDYAGFVLNDGLMPSWYSEDQENALVDMTKSYTIFANTQMNDDFWIDRSIKGFFRYNFDDKGSHKSCIYAQLEPLGKLQFEANGADLSGLKELRFSIRTMTPEATLRMKVNGISGHIKPDEEWRDHSFPFNFFMMGKDVKSIMFKNISRKPITILFDDIQFI